MYLHVCMLHIIPAGAVNSTNHSTCRVLPKKNPKQTATGALMWATGIKCASLTHTQHTHTNTNHNTYTPTLFFTTIHRPSSAVTRICLTASKLTSTHASHLQHSPVRLCKKSSRRTDRIYTSCIMSGDHSLSPPPPPSLSFCFSRTALYLLHFVDPLLNSSTQELQQTPANCMVRWRV